jgi:hypothetical protein
MHFRARKCSPKYETAHSASCLRTGIDAVSTTYRPSTFEAPPWNVSTFASGESDRMRHATAHSDHAVRQVTCPVVPTPSSASMAAPPAERSRRSSPVRCSPAAALRVRPAIASMTAPPPTPARPRGDGYTVTFCGTLRAALVPLIDPTTTPKSRGLFRPRPGPRLQDSGNPRCSSNRNLLFAVNSYLV